MLPTGGGEKKQAQVTASGGARGVDPEKDSKGGSNPKHRAGEACRPLTSRRSRKRGPAVRRFIRGRLLFSGWLLLGYVVLAVVAARQGLGDAALLSAIARLALVLAIVNAAVTLLVNPWRDDRPSDRFPGDRAGRCGDRHLHGDRHGAVARAAADHVRRRRGGGRLRAAGHARQPVCRARHPDREAVSRRPVGAGRARARRPGPGDHLARHQAAHQGGPVPDRSKQRDRERTGAQLLRADGADADRR